MRKQPKETAVFTFYNANPLNKRVGDCVIRALSLTPGYDWWKVYHELCDYGETECCTPTDDEAWDAFLKKHKYKRYKMPRKADRKLYTLAEFVKSDLIKDDDIVVVSICGHLTCVKGRKVHDTWDCSEYTVRRYYKYEAVTV